MKKIYHSNQDLSNWVHNIMRSMADDNWQPDLIVGITRGGLIPAMMLSQYLKVPMQALQVSLRDGGDCVSDLGLAEDAFGYVPTDEQPTYKSRWDISRRKKILVVDDINDTGATINWIMQDWPSGVFPQESQTWETIWHRTVRFAVLVDNMSSNFNDVDYVGIEINKAEDPAWIVFPWENWWENKND